MPPTPSPTYRGDLRRPPGHLRRARGAEPTGWPTTWPDSGSGRRSRRALRPQLHRGDRDAARGVQAPRRGHQHQLPLRRERVAVHVRATRTWPRWCTTRSSRRSSPGRPRPRPACAAWWRSTTADARPRRAAELRYAAALAAASPERDFPPAQQRRRLHHLHRRDDRLPEGRHVAPRGHLAHARPAASTSSPAIPLADEWEQSRQGAGGRRDGQALRGAAHPRQRPGGRAGGPVRRGDRGAAAAFDPHEIWRAIAAAPGQRAGHHRRRDGQAAGRGLPGRRATTPPRWSPSPPARRCSRPRSRTPAPRRCPTSSSPRRSAPPRPASPASASCSAGDEQRGGPTVIAGPDVIVLDRRRRPGRSRPGRPAGPGRARPARLLQGPGQDRRACSPR